MADEKAKMVSAVVDDDLSRIYLYPTHSICESADGMGLEQAYEGGVHTKRFFARPVDKWTDDLIDMDRNG